MASFKFQSQYLPVVVEEIHKVPQCLGLIEITFFGI
jgi:hypothetical protein